MLVLWARSNFFLLTNPVAQYLGTVSYSVYLRHWPLLTIAHYFGYGDTPIQTAVPIALTSSWPTCRTGSSKTRPATPSCT